MLKIDKLVYNYGNKQALEDISLYIEKGEFIGIIGPNGSGKSTLLKNISNYLQPTSGAIYLNQRLLNQYSAAELARQLAVVPQETYTNYNFSVYDLVMMGRNPYQDRWGRVNKEDREIVREAMEMTDILKFKNQGIKQLSGGERQRVIIARALAQKPQILLLDEPTASLDINYQQEIFSLLLKLNRELGITIIVVSHDLNLSGQYCSKLVLLAAGKITRIGSPEEVLTAANIKKVYQTEVMVEKNPLTDRPFIIMIPEKRINPGKKIQNGASIPRIHVVCGGGTGRKLFGLLFREGYQVSCGVLNQGDADWEMAIQLGMEVAEAPPFSPLSKEGLLHNQQLLAKADLIIVTDVPFGNGNLENLSQLLELTVPKIILYTKKDIAERDFTAGIASRYWRLLLKKKNVLKVTTLAELKNLLDNIRVD